MFVIHYKYNDNTKEQLYALLVEILIKEALTDDNRVSKSQHRDTDSRTTTKGD